jgi:hypothetical protein
MPAESMTASHQVDHTDGFHRGGVRARSRDRIPGIDREYVNMKLDFVSLDLLASYLSSWLAYKFKNA